jgi:hypothetical protein
MVLSIKHPLKVKSFVIIIIQKHLKINFLTKMLHIGVLRALKDAWRVIWRAPETFQRQKKAEALACSDQKGQETCEISVPPVPLRCLVCRRNADQSIKWQFNDNTEREEQSM